MLKKIMALIVLSSLLLGLIWLKSNTALSVTNILVPADDSPEYKMVEYKIININGNEYHGKAEDGAEIHFSAEKIPSDYTILVEDEIICYFQKDALADGVVKVVKK